jgi:AhpC/TSA family
MKQQAPSGSSAKPKPIDSVLVELEKIKNEESARMQTLMQAYQKAKTDEEKSKIVGEGLAGISKAFLPRYEALEKKSNGPTRLQVRMAMLNLVSQGGQPGASDGILTRIVKEDRDLPDASRMAMQIRFMAYEGPKAEAKAEILLGDLGKSKAPSVRAATLFATAEVWGEKKPKEAIKLLRQLIVEYPKSESALKAKGSLFALENLAIGMVAPNISGTDHEGKSFNLSEYKGKVVVLDFWGFW